MNETQKQKLLDFGKQKLESIVLEDFIKIRSALADLKQDKDPESNFKKLKEHVNRYERFTNEFKETYGVEFKDVKEWYNKISSDINKYLQADKNSEEKTIGNINYIGERKFKN
jgi:hypothetical protein